MTQVPEDLAAVLFDAAPDAVIATNSEGIIVAANIRACRLLGYRAGRLVGREARTVFADWFDDAFRRFDEKYRECPWHWCMDVDGTVTMQLRSGDKRPISATLSPARDPNGGLLALVGFHDAPYDPQIPEVDAIVAAATNSSVQAQQVSAEYQRALDHYNRVVRHRIANPLQVILGMTKTLLMMPDIAEDSRRSMLDAMEDAANQLADESLFDPELHRAEESGLYAVPSVRAKKWRKRR